MRREGAPTAKVARVRQRVRAAAARLGLGVSFGEGRRASDVSLVVVKGDRAQVLRSYTELFEGLDLDVELVRSASSAEAYEVVVALMVPREARERVDGERRASELGDEEP